MTNPIVTMLRAVFSSSDKELTTSDARQFLPTKQLSERDSILVDMLNSKGHEHVCFCICDPDKPDLPIVFASDGFCAFTGYNYEEIEGRNCRFLQGEETDPWDVNKIRMAIENESPMSVNLLNYRKDGSTFFNEFFICPLYDEHGKLCYFIGVQKSVSKLGPGQMPANEGWVYALGTQA